MKIANNKKILLLLSSLSSINCFSKEIKAIEENVEIYKNFLKNENTSEQDLQITLFLKNINILQERETTDGQDTVGKCAE